MSRAKVYISHSLGLPDITTQTLLKQVPCNLLPERLPKVDLRTTVCSRLLLGHVLAQATGQSQEDIQLARSAYGRPYLLGESDTDFNLSHQGPWCAVGCVQDTLRSWGIGVDIVDSTQGNDAPSRHLDALRPHLTLKEHMDVSGRPSMTDQLVQASRIWGAKEAYVKAIGLGLSMALNRLEVTFHPQDNRITYCLDGQDLHKCSSQWFLLPRDDVVDPYTLIVALVPISTKTQMGGVDVAEPCFVALMAT
ncbi:hypothetical protein BJ684DRAFT_18717 [Piptocephalis cylindrospora]|uniref:holo-[acyl-carrier-protein] synthase n=1 Tax=Piptocephalis cylindrospora TaxID=1907219 RepID=A0A4P9Y721_9FUNG|nr:hypothetical protein BJ684DRAFT_18717 [Piptocephalis cylindrospora]|eukprot:RKP14906.1 hypothetical protein BJ684DRAFT_18717 [Piptocephalis cylindrospora]